MELIFSIFMATSSLGMNTQYQQYILEACEQQHQAEPISLADALSEVYD